MLHISPEASVSLFFAVKHTAYIPPISPRPSSLSFAVYFTLYRNGINQPRLVSAVNCNWFLIISLTLRCDAGVSSCVLYRRVLPTDVLAISISSTVVCVV